MADRVALEELTIGDFSGRIGDSFRIAYPNHEESLTLVEAARSHAVPPPGARTPFSLFFLGESRTHWLKQGIHPLQHPDLPGLEIFLTCIGPDPDGRFRYEADFT